LERGEGLASYVRTLCEGLAAKAGIEKRVHPHGLRHGWTLAQVQSGTSLNTIQQLLGHRSLHTTSVYLQHIAPAKAVAEATEKTAHLAVQPQRSDSPRQRGGGRVDAPGRRR
jgi:site-specific recombinase XerD